MKLYFKLRIDEAFTQAFKARINRYIFDINSTVYDSLKFFVKRNSISSKKKKFEALFSMFANLHSTVYLSNLPSNVFLLFLHLLNRSKSDTKSTRFTFRLSRCVFLSQISKRVNFPSFPLQLTYQTSADPDYRQKKKDFFNFGNEIIFANFFPHLKRSWSWFICDSGRLDESCLVTMINLQED